MKKFVVVLSGAILISTCSNAKIFNDVTDDYWAKNIINEWTDNGIMSGYNDGSFKPNGEVTRAELAIILNNINNDTQNIRKRPSKDIKLSDWYCYDMAVALNNGFIELDENGNLLPNSSVTREEAMAMTAKLFNLKYTGNPYNILNKFSDAKYVDEDNLPYVAALVDEGYVSGTNNKLNPNNNITRVELLAMLDKIIEKICTSGKVSNEDLQGNLVINGNDVSLSNVQVDGYIYLLKGTKDGNINFNNVYASKGIMSDYDDVISYNDGTKKHDNLSNIEEEKHNSKVQFVKINYSETDWTNGTVTATLKFNDDDMEIINNNGKNKYKFRENGEFTFICVDDNGNEHRYTAKVNNIAKKDIKLAVDVQDNVSDAVVNVNILENEAPIKEMYFIAGKNSASKTLDDGEEVVNNQFKVTETGYYTVAVKDEAGNTAKTEFYWKNTSQHTITVVQNTGGLISPETTQVYHDDSVTFNITVDEINGYYLAEVLIDGISKGVITTYTFDNVKESHTIEAVFRLHKYDVTVIQTENGLIEPETTAVEFGGNQKFTITPNEGYLIEEVIIDQGTENEKSLGAVSEYEFENIREPHTITATYKIMTFTITVEPGLNGKITPETIVVSYGDNKTFYIEPDEHYEIKDVLVDNVSVGATLSYSLMNIKENHYIVAIFAEIPQSRVLSSGQIGEKVYATVYEDYSCIIYGMGDTYNYAYPAETVNSPLGEYAHLIKNVTVKLGVTNIGDGLFAGCESLTNITILDSVTDFGKYAFADCTNLVEVIIPDAMEEIKEGTFYNCKYLERIIIPDSIKIIGDDAFNGCHTLETKTLPKDLVEIGDRAFKDCKGLIESMTIPEGTQNIGEEAFMGCSLLTSFEIPKTVEFIGKDAFDDCGTLKNITFKNRRTIESLGEEWFPNGGDYKKNPVGNNYVITRLTFEIKVGATEHGTIAPQTMNVPKATDKEYIFTPEIGYEVENVVIDGESIGAVSSYTFKSVNSTHTVSATFKPKTYEIVYELNGGTSQAPENPSFYTLEDRVKLTSPTKRGYTFAGWIGTDLATPTTNVEFYGEIGSRYYEATWNVITYNITYNIENGVTDNPTTYTVETETFPLTHPVRNGYEFVGWTNDQYTFPNPNVSINKGTIGDRFYNANWRIKEYAILYELNGGTIVGTNPDNYTVESMSITLKNPTKVGYDFTGWTGTGLDDKQTSVTIERSSYGDREYVATWNPVQYFINYDLAGGTLAGSNPYIYTIETENITLVNPTREGYTFAGWSGTDIGTTSTGVVITKGSIGNRSYVANWIPN